MTIGIAATVWDDPSDPMVFIAADCRLSRDQVPLSDGGIKTYDVGPRVGLVASGNALPSITASELTRSIVGAHNRDKATPEFGFYDTVRLLSYFTHRVAEAPMWTSESIAVGFFRSGAPALARILVDEHRSVVTFIRHTEGSLVAVPVGSPAARNLLLCGMVAARQEGRPTLASALSLIHYMGAHDGFKTIGRGLAVGVCRRASEDFSWPVIEVEGRRYLRGIDVTESAPATWPQAIPVAYDESWCAEMDRAAADRPPGGEMLADPPRPKFGSVEIETFASSGELFRHHPDPEGF